MPVITYWYVGYQLLACQLSVTGVPAISYWCYLSVTGVPDFTYWSVCYQLLLSLSGVLDTGVPVITFGVLVIGYWCARCHLLACWLLVISIYCFRLGELIAGIVSTI